MIRLLTLPLLLLGFVASAQTVTPTNETPRIGLNKPASNSNLATSIIAKPSPLYIVDGSLLEATRLNDISPDRIESINVVKGSEVLALYGERGRGGVILITTKPTKAGH